MAAAAPARRCILELGSFDKVHLSNSRYHFLVFPFRSEAKGATFAFTCGPLFSWHRRGRRCPHQIFPVFVRGLTSSTNTFPVRFAQPVDSDRLPDELFLGWSYGVPDNAARQGERSAMLLAKTTGRALPTTRHVHVYIVTICATL